MFIQLFYCNCLSVQIGLWMNDRIFDAFFLMNDWLSNVYSHKSLPRHYAEQGNVGSLLLSLTLFAAFIKPKMGFHYWTQLAQNIKKNHSVYKQKLNEFPFVREMQSSVFNEFWLVFCLFCTVYLEGLVVYCENWVLFVISHQKTFWGFLVHSNFVLRSPENLKRFFDSRCQTVIAAQWNSILTVHY